MRMEGWVDVHTPRSTSTNSLDGLKTSSWPENTHSQGGKPKPRTWDMWDQHSTTVMKILSVSSKLISAYGCMDFSSYFQAGSESRSVGRGLSRRPPSAGQTSLAALRGSLGLDSCPAWQMCIYILCCGRAVCLDLLNEYYYYYYYYY